VVPLLPKPQRQRNLLPRNPRNLLSLPPKSQPKHLVKLKVLLLPLKVVE
jgi:hypothetical protein